MGCWLQARALRKSAEPWGSHAEHLALVRSASDGVCFDRIVPVHQRYAIQKTGSSIEMWTLAHELQEIEHGKTLRIILDQPASVVWSVNDWQTVREIEANDSLIGCWSVDFPAGDLAASPLVVFTFRFNSHWNGDNFRVRIGSKS